MYKRQIAGMGYDGVEPYTLYNYTPEEFKAILDEFGLKAMSTHAPVQEFENPDNGGIDAVAEKYAKIGCDYVALPYILDVYKRQIKKDLHAERSPDRGKGKRKLPRRSEVPPKS